jgi:hypothetical protein
MDFKIRWSFIKQMPRNYRRSSRHNRMI